MLAWEYPPLVEGRLARHVDRLTHALDRRHVSVQVLTRGVGGAGTDRRAAQVRSGGGGVRVERVEHESRPGELDLFMRWVPRLNDRLLQGAE